MTASRIYTKADTSPQPITEQWSNWKIIPSPFRSETIEHFKINDSALHHFFSKLPNNRGLCPTQVRSLSRVCEITLRDQSNRRSPVVRPNMPRSLYDVQDRQSAQFTIASSDTTTKIKPGQESIPAKLVSKDSSTSCPDHTYLSRDSCRSGQHNITTCRGDRSDAV